MGRIFLGGFLSVAIICIADSTKLHLLFSIDLKKKSKQPDWLLFTPLAFFLLMNNSGNWGAVLEGTFLEAPSS